MAAQALTNDGADTVPPSSALLSSTTQQSWNGKELLVSLQRLGVAHDLKEDDLTLPDLQQATSSTSSSSSSMSMLLSRLSLLLSDLGRLQETQIKTHLTTLLDSASNVQTLEGQVRDVRKSLTELEVAVEKLSNPTRTSLVRLQRDQKRFQRLQSVQDLLTKASRYVVLARRLESHLQALFDDGDSSSTSQKEQAMIESARCLESLTALTVPPLTSLDFIQSYTPSIQSARSQVIDQMESSIVIGLRDLSPSLLSCSLQTAEILRVLPDLVSNLLHDLTDVVKRCVVRALGVVVAREWDVALQQADNAEQDSSGAPTPYRSRRTQPQQQKAQPRQRTTTHPAVTHIQDVFRQHWHTLMTVEMTAVCSKIYLLQRVLGLMRSSTGGDNLQQDAAEPESQEEEESNPRTLLDEGVKVSKHWPLQTRRTGQQLFLTISALLLPQILGEPPTLLFWRTLSTSLESGLSRIPPTFFSTPLASEHPHATPTPTSRLHNSRYHPTWESHLSRTVDFFFEKTSVWTGISGQGGPEQAFVRRSIGLA